MRRLACAAVLGMVLASAQPASADDSSSSDTPQPTGYLATVRLTYYLEAGRTYSGVQTYPGSTACSWNYPLWSTFVFRDGETVTCTDRGILGNVGWLDVFRNAPLAAKYGRYTTVQVIEP